MDRKCAAGLGFVNALNGILLIAPSQP